MAVMFPVLSLAAFAAVATADQHPAQPLAQPEQDGFGKYMGAYLPPGDDRYTDSWTGDNASFRNYMTQYSASQANYTKYTSSYGGSAANYEQYVTMYAGMAGAAPSSGSDWKDKEAEQKAAFNRSMATTFAQYIPGAYNDVAMKSTERLQNQNASAGTKLMKPQGGDYQQYMSKYAGDYQKYMQQGGGSQQGGAQGGDYQQYMSKYAGDYQKYMQKGDVKNSSAGGGDYQQYMTKYAGDYQKYMQQGGAQNGSGGDDDYQQYMSKYAGGHPQAQWMPAHQNMTQDELRRQFAGKYLPQVRNESDPAAWRDAFAGKYLPHVRNESDPAAWREAFAGSNLLHVHNESDPSAWRDAFLKKYGGDYRHFAASREPQQPQAPCSPEDCTSVADLKKWRAAELQQLDNYVPKAFRAGAEAKVEHDFDEARSRLANASQTSGTSAAASATASPASSTRGSAPRAEPTTVARAAGQPSQALPALTVRRPADDEVPVVAATGLRGTVAARSPATPGAWGTGASAAALFAAVAGAGLAAVAIARRRRGGAEQLEGYHLQQV